MAKKGLGRTIYGESANAWERRTRSQLLRPYDEGGFGYSEEAVTKLEAELAKDKRKLADEPEKVAIKTDSFSVIAVENDEPKEVVVKALPNAKVGEPYLVQLSATGGYLPVRFEGVKMPPGISVDLHGVVSGSFLASSESGQVDLTVRAVDRFDNKTDATFQVAVEALPEVEEDEGEEEDEKAALSNITPQRPSLLSVASPAVLDAATRNAKPVEQTPQGEGEPGESTSPQGTSQPVNTSPQASDQPQANTDQPVLQAGSEAAQPVTTEAAPAQATTAQPVESQPKAATTETDAKGRDKE
jgi:hypothetical protein